VCAGTAAAAAAYPSADDNRATPGRRWTATDGSTATDAGSKCRGGQHTTAATADAVDSATE